MTVSNVVVDFQLMYDQLQAKLSEKGTWIDTLPTAVGTTILDTFAGSSVSNQYYIDVSLREAFLPLAVRDSSIFAGTRMLGVQIARKTPASFTGEISNYGLTTKYIQPYAQFDVGGVKAFVRGQYVVAPGQTISDVNFYIGEYKEKVFALDSIPDLALKEFYLGVPGFVVSAADMLVYTRNKNSGATQIWTRTDNAIFEHGADDFVYYESTSRDGDVSLFFGDGVYGKRLSTEDDLVVQYVETNGSVGNVGLPGIQLRAINTVELKGATVSAISGGADEKSAVYYKMFGSKMSRTKKRSISNPDIRATLAGFPGVADVALFGQRDIAPNDPRWMNMFRMCILPEEADDFGGANPNPRSPAWQQIVDFIKPQLHAAYGNNIQTWNPSKLFVDIRLRVALKANALEGEVKIAAAEAVLKLFKKKPGILGRRLSQSDIIEAVRKIPGVDYVIVDSPIEEIIPADATQYVVLNGIPDITTFYSERTTSV